MYECASWTIKKAECRRIGAFELWCWRRLLRVPWTARRPTQSILKEISPGYSLERLMLKLKLQYFGHLVQRADSLEKTLMLGRIEGRRRRGWQRMRWLDGITDWCATVHGVTKSWTQVSDWTEMKSNYYLEIITKQLSQHHIISHRPNLLPLSHGESPHVWLCFWALS